MFNAKVPRLKIYVEDCDGSVLILNYETFGFKCPFVLLTLPI